MLSSTEKSGINPFLSLGTAALGMNYGIANIFGPPNENEVDLIFRFAQSVGIQHFDTAMAYGLAESLIGKFLPADSAMNITTKISPKFCKEATGIIDSVKESLTRTNQKSFWAVLLHDSSIFLDGSRNQIIEGMSQLLEADLATNIGVSVYSEEEVLRCKEIFPLLNVFQIPENILDRRSHDSSVLRDCANSGDFLIVRSIFLQGLLLMNPSKLPPGLSDAENAIKQLHDYCDGDLTRVANLCISYAKSIPWASGVVVGVASLNQLQSLSPETVKGSLIDVMGFDQIPSAILDPRGWLK